ncbi:uncharacterized protein LOC116205442 [Punica granatum]|uniref:Uncharacterized protein LOC116205442 n=1 Tax=Punica granatum TaxID=22663 RepID=A0A6P8D9V9_PUNGR|nr:uncharacterized protein LOC116205442 [Punica granatum]
MGKGAAEEGQELPLTDPSVSITSERTGHPQIRCGCGRILRHVGLKCVLVLILSVAGFLSALFWLPPFLNLGDRGDLDLDSRFRGHDIVASFYVGKRVSLLKENIMLLEDDIFGEMNAPTIKVVVLSIEPVPGQNISKVYFAVDPDADSPRISIAAQSLIRASFSSLVSHQLSLRLTASLFGDPFSFEVEKFRGGITVIPPQSAFLLQKVQIYFNFTLNFSIEEIQLSFYELTSQLKLGLRLSPYENLYIRLSNFRGSTVDAPTIVQSSVLLAVGAQSSTPRLKQLAQTITGNSHSRNLGLNNTMFGRVKQVRLSSILQHSLNGGDGGGAPSSSPAPQPFPHHHHHHHQHHHHHHSDDPPLGPTMPPRAPTHGGHSPTWRKISPAPQPSSSHARRKHLHSPAPSTTHEAKPPGCRYRQKRRSAGPAPEQSHVTPTASPAFAPQHSVAPPPAQRHPPPASSVSIQGPLPHAAFGKVQPPSKSKSDSAHSDSVPSISPSPYSSSTSQLSPLRWVFLLFVVLVLHL